MACPARSFKPFTALGFDAPTPIQLGAIGPALQGRDVLGCAHTGSGKTLAFALPLLQSLSGSTGRLAQALVLVPTRELATQVGDSDSVPWRSTCRNSPG